MAQNGPLTSSPRCAADKGPNAAELFDPLALEERLKEARARRAEALARRDDGEPPAGHHAPAAFPARETRPSAFEPAQPSPPPSLETVAPAPAWPPQRPQARIPQPPLIGPAPARLDVPADPGPAPEGRARRPRRIGRVLLALLFVSGIGLGAAAALVAPDLLRERVAALSAGLEPSDPLGQDSATAQKSAEAAAPPLVATSAPALPAAPAPESLPARPPVISADLRTRAAASEPAATDATAHEAAAAPSAATAEDVAAAAPVTPGLIASREPADAAAAAPTERTAPPATRSTDPGPANAPETPAAGPAASGAADAADAPAYDPAALRVLLNHPATVDAATVDAALAALREAGFGEVAQVPARVSISRTNVRYFHDEDGAAATDIAKLLGTRLEGDPPLARDFTSFNPPPARGLIEIWLSGDAPARSAGREASAPTEPRPQAATARRDAAAGQVSQLESMVDAERLRALLEPVDRVDTARPPPSAGRAPLSAMPWLDQREP